MKKGLIPAKDIGTVAKPEKASGKSAPAVSAVKPTPAFTKELAREIVKNLMAFGRLTTTPFRKRENEPAVEKKETPLPTGEHPILVDTSILIDGRIVPVVNSGFFVGTLLIPQYILGEIQHIADSEDSIRRAKGRRGLEIVNTLKNQKNNAFVRLLIIPDDTPEVKEVDLKLVALAKRWRVPVLTVDFNLAQVARVQGIKVFNMNDLSQALKVALMPGEEITLKITHIGKERAQGVGYLSDGTMVVVEDTKERIGQDVTALITKVHQTPAGQLFFARMK